MLLNLRAAAGLGQSEELSPRQQLLLATEAGQELLQDLCEEKAAAVTKLTADLKRLKKAREDQSKGGEQQQRALLLRAAEQIQL